MATMVIVGIVVAVVVVAAVGVTAAVLLSGGGGGAGGGGTGGQTINSLSCTVDINSEGQTISAEYKAKDIGTQNMKVRVDMLLEGQQVAYIINGAERKAWAYALGQWVDMSSSFDQYWDMYSESVSDYRTRLSGWTGGDITYSMDSTTVRMYNIQLNPSLSDSLFSPS
jgi:hypothetical protein